MKPSITSYSSIRALILPHQFCTLAGPLSRFALPYLRTAMWLVKLNYYPLNHVFFLHVHHIRWYQLSIIHISNSSNITLSIQRLLRVHNVAFLFILATLQFPHDQPFHAERFNSQIVLCLKSWIFQIFPNPHEEDLNFFRLPSFGSCEDVH